MMCRSSHFSVAYRPASQMVTCPPPYSPAAMVPEKEAYSSGWSSVGTASRLVPARRRPLGHRPALQDAVALEPQVPVHPLPGRRGGVWCSWTTNVSSFPAGRALPAGGTGSAVRRGRAWRGTRRAGRPAGRAGRGHVRRCGGRAWPAACPRSSSRRRLLRRGLLRRRLLRAVAFFGGLLGGGGLLGRRLLPGRLLRRRLRLLGASSSDPPRARSTLRRRALIRSTTAAPCRAPRAPAAPRRRSAWPRAARSWPRGSRR